MKVYKLLYNSNNFKLLKNLNNKHKKTVIFVNKFCFSKVNKHNLLPKENNIKNSSLYQKKLNLSKIKEDNLKDIETINNKSLQDKVYNYILNNKESEESSLIKVLSFMLSPSIISCLLLTYSIFLCDISYYISSSLLFKQTIIFNMGYQGFIYSYKNMKLLDYYSDYYVYNSFDNKDILINDVRELKFYSILIVLIFGFSILIMYSLSYNKLCTLIFCLLNILNSSFVNKHLINKNKTHKTINKILIFYGLASSAIMGLLLFNNIKANYKILDYSYKNECIIDLKSMGEIIKEDEELMIDESRLYNEFFDYIINNDNKELDYK